MIIADAIGIVIGIVIGKKIPERVVKWFAAIIFILFGLIGLYQYLPGTLLTPVNIVVAILLISGAVFFVARGGNAEKKVDAGA
jgi:predicted membrane channel-forming protein YqfA (hemolysin III family)